jgi:type IV secretion system protein VirB5
MPTEQIEDHRAKQPARASTQTTLTPTDNLDTLSPIKKDEIAEEVFAARLYAKRLTRTVVTGQSMVIVLFALCIYGLATRPAKRVYIKLDQFGRATPVKYSDLEHYTPDAAVAKSYLADWATFRFGRLRASVLKTFPKNYLFLEAKYGQQIKDRDQRDNVVANILAGHDPENDVTILSTNLTSFGKQSLGNAVVAGGTADIALQKMFRKDGETHVQTWIIAVRFYLNPDQVDAQSEDNPDYQSINPLGLTIVEFIANRPNVEASPK